MSPTSVANIDAQESWTRIEIDEKVGKAITPDFDMYSYNRNYYYGYNYGPYYGYDGYSYSPYYSSPHVFRGGQYNRFISKIRKIANFP